MATTANASFLGEIINEVTAGIVTATAATRESYNAIQLRSQNIDADLEDAPVGSVLYWTGSEWTFSLTGATGAVGVCDANGNIVIGSSATMSGTAEDNVVIGCAAGGSVSFIFDDSVIIGNGAGSGTDSGSNRIAIGASAAQTAQGTHSIAIGSNAGASTQSGSALAVGRNAGQTAQAANAVALGINAGANTQAASSVAVGSSSGLTAQGSNSVAVGVFSGSGTQGQGCVSIGQDSGRVSQGNAGVAVGRESGYTSQGAIAVAMGYQAGANNQGTQAVAIGYGAGQATQGEDAVAIGMFAGQTSQAANSIVISSLGTVLNNTVASSCKIAPLRSNPGITASTGGVVYSTSTNELFVDTSKSFVIQHPSYLNKYLVHGCLEGPEAGVYYRGEGRIQNGQTKISLPDYAKKIATDFTVNITPIFDGKNKNLSASRVNDGVFTVHGEDGFFNWVAYGKRFDFDIEPNKSDYVLRGDGPYTYLRRR